MTTQEGQMGSIKISDKTKVLIVLAIAIFEIAFINFTKDQPKIENTQANQEVVVQGVEKVDQHLVEEVSVNQNTEDTEDTATSQQDIIIEVDESLQSPLETGGKELAVHFMDVGQADAVYIGYGDFDMVIDGGNNEDGPFVVNYLEDKVTGPIEMVIGSHAHEDHIGGLDDVMEAYPIKMLIDSGEIKDTRTYEDYMAAGKKSGAVIMEDATRHYDIDDQFAVDIIEAVDGESNTNNNSIIVKITYNQVSFLFTGDLEEEIESKLLTKDLKATVFKAGHHGSSTSNSDMFMRRVQPQMVVISAGAGNKYGHPHAEALSRMRKHTNQIFGTWKDGTIVVRTDGVDIQTDATQVVTMDDASASGGASESDSYKNYNKSSDNDWLKNLIKPSKKQTKNNIEDMLTEAVTDAVVDVVVDEVSDIVTNQVQEDMREQEDVQVQETIQTQENVQVENEEKKNELIIIDFGE